jgi:hypothetical protein
MTLTTNGTKQRLGTKEPNRRLRDMVSWEEKLALATINVTNQPLNHALTSNRVKTR